MTGGTGFVGSHTCVELLKAGYRLVVVDSLVNSNQESLERVLRITEKPAEDLVFHAVDLIDREALERVFEAHPEIDSVIHFAALKAVGESVVKPLDYYENNLVGVINLLKAMRTHGIRKFIFSSSATVYGEPERVPLTEDCATRATNPYGQTKLMAEQILRDFFVAQPESSIVLLRYFNPAGAHPSGLLGEDPKGTPNNLLPVVLQVAVGKLPKVSVFGSDWPTRDGSGVRDYIHIVDLAQGHVSALKYADAHQGCEAFNLGTGTGYSVLELIEQVKKVSGKDIPYALVDRRPGDIAECYADPSKARRLLGWEAKLGVEQMVQDAWNWISKNPDGIKSSTA